MKARRQTLLILIKVNIQSYVFITYSCWIFQVKKAIHTHTEDIVKIITM